MTLPEVTVGSKWRSTDRRDAWQRLRQERVVVWVKDGEVLFHDACDPARRTVDGGIEGVRPL